MKIDIERTITLLDELTRMLQALKLWQTLPLTTDELASSAPFSCDTLAFEQWLQFIFIPKIMQMIKLGQTLPTTMALSPMAEQAFGHLTVNVAPLLDVIQKLDKTMTEQGK